MPISLRQFEYIMRMVIEWANDVPFENWFQLIKETYNLGEQDTAPDYEITLENGRPYLFDPLYGGRRPSLDMTTYMETNLDVPKTSENSILDRLD